jgi:hypothetical protein
MKKIILISLFLGLTGFASAQATSEIKETSYGSSYQTDTEVKQQMNLFKVNLTAIPIRNYSFQFERVLTKKLSVALSYKTMPSGNIPFKNSIISMSDDDPDVEDMLNKLTLSHTAFTPEVRWYVGKKGYGRGFYIAPFYRYAKFNASNLSVSYEEGGPTPTENTITLEGSNSANTFGVMFGAQWALSKHLVLDWWILGPHVGNSSGELIGNSSSPMSTEAQNEIRDALESIDIPFIEKTVTVTSNRASVAFDGLWGGLRAGISFGFKF